MEEEWRPDPDKILNFIKKEEETSNKGKLKIFFGMSPGVGKTYTMLQTAQTDKSKQIDVVVGYVESHNRPETNALLEGLEIIPRKKIEYKGILLEEMDLDAILKRNPYLVLVDELAHTNAEGSRHAKRYQDVQELLDNGINVYTTLNIQHLESKNDTVSQITGITVQETLPDEIFELAEEIELIDISPNTLLDRLAEGKIYTPDQSKEALLNFFKEGNITALREMALRLVADRVDKQLKSYMKQKHIKGPWKSGLHLMVLISSNKSSARIIRWAKNLSYTMGADLTALHVENTKYLDINETDQLTKNIDLARQLGAEVIVKTSTNVIKTALEIARQENITHIIIGKSEKKRFGFPFFYTNNYIYQLIKESGEIDVYVIESELKKSNSNSKKLNLDYFYSTPKKYLAAFIIVLCVVLICLPLTDKLGYQSISFIFLFVVSFMGLYFRLGPLFLASGLMALSWDFFFIPPKFTLVISKPEDLLALLMFFIIALINGLLTYRVKKKERLTNKRETKTNALLHLTNQLVVIESIKNILLVAQQEIKRYFEVEPIFILADDNENLKRKAFNVKEINLTDSEYSIALWSFKHQKKAGKYTDTLPSSNYTFYPLKGARIKIGIVAIKQNKPFNGETELFWETFLSQINNSIEHQKLLYLAKKNSLLHESDRLYKILFSSISNELKTPVNTIMEASNNLLLNEYSKDFRVKLYNEITTSAKVLNRLIINLLNMYKLDSGIISPKMDWCNIEDLFNKVKESLKDELKSFKFDIIVQPSIPLVKLDAELMEQVLYNLVYNSCKYSKPNTSIKLKAFYDSNSLVIEEMDRGVGFSKKSLPYIFNRFYKEGDKQTEGIGLGLSIVKGFVNVHRGTVVVENREGKGIKFTIKIPVEDILL